jgi:hypothetical protein
LTDKVMRFGAQAFFLHIIFQGEDDPGRLPRYLPL